MATTIQTASLSDFYSPALAQDTAFVAISDALTPVLRDFVSQISKAVIFPNLPNQPEAILDFLALWHFNVDAYDVTWPVPQKLLSIQNVMLDKLTKGTPARVRSIVAQSGLKYIEIQEWWQTSPPGPPYTFSIVLADPNPSLAVVNATVAAVMKAKNVRSYLSNVGSIETPSGAAVYVSVSSGEIDYEVVGVSAGRP